MKKKKDFKDEEKIVEKNQQNGTNNRDMLHRVLDAVLVLSSVQLHLSACVQAESVASLGDHLASRADDRLHELGPQSLHLLVHERGLPQQLSARARELQLLFRLG